MSTSVWEAEGEEFGRRSDGDGMATSSSGRADMQVLSQQHSGVHGQQQKCKKQQQHTGSAVVKPVEQRRRLTSDRSVRRTTAMTFVPHEPYKAAVSSKSTTTSSAAGHLHFLTPFTGALCRGGSASGGGAAVKWLDGANDDDRSERIIGVREVPSAERVWAAERSRLELELKSLRLDNQQLETQLRVQTQVNGELKRLLVASVGEDMESRVHFLTEDKTRLAHSLMHYSQKQTKDTEDLERLSIQCDVWRSKFLATSLMVDELASWKAVLGYRLDEAREAIHVLLEELDKVHHHVRSALGSLGSLFDSRSLPDIGIDRTSSERCVIQDAESVKELASTLRSDLMNADAKTPASRSLLEASTASCPRSTQFMTNGQRLAHQVLLNSDNFDQLPSHSMASSSMPPRFHLSTRYEHLTFNCCGHCKGDIKLM